MGQGKLSRDQLPADPIPFFHQWMHEAKEAGELEPEAMALATASPEGRPSLRHVLLKSADASGFLFFTDLRSRKARELTANPQATLCFRWNKLDRQITVEGSVVQVPKAEADSYFQRRMRSSQLSSWASLQGEPIADREQLEREVVEVEKRHGDGPIPTPPHWVGFRVHPVRIEFWQGREYRRHDRFTYRLDGNVWVITRLSP